MDHLHDMHSYAREHLKLPSDRMRTRYDRLATYVGYHEDDNVALSPDSHDGEIVRTPILLGGPVQGSNPDK
jgi:hypothetical protein